MSTVAGGAETTLTKQGAASVQEIVPPPEPVPGSVGVDVPDAGGVELEGGADVVAGAEVVGGAPVMSQTA
jgi:hypothetical protein